MGFQIFHCFFVSNMDRNESIWVLNLNEFIWVLNVDFAIRFIEELRKENGNDELLLAKKTNKK